MEEGDGGQVELIKGGKNVSVTPSNVYDYVRLYAEHRMVGHNKKALQVNFNYLPVEYWKYDRLVNHAPCEPIRFKTETSRYVVNRVFPRFGEFSISLDPSYFCLYSDWLLLVLQSLIFKSASKYSYQTV